MKPFTDAAVRGSTSFFSSLFLILTDLCWATFKKHFYWIGGGRFVCHATTFRLIKNMSNPRLSCSTILRSEVHRQSPSIRVKIWSTSSSYSFSCCCSTSWTQTEQFSSYLISCSSPACFQKSFEDFKLSSLKRKYQRGHIAKTAQVQLLCKNFKSFPL